MCDAEGGGVDLVSWRRGGYGVWEGVKEMRGEGGVDRVYGCNQGAREICGGMCATLDMRSAALSTLYRWKLNCYARYVSGSEELSCWNCATYYRI